jgi:hypothetical protein
MDALEKQNKALIVVANQILNKHGLFKILKKYGTPFITGSYALELMTRRDLDISLETDDMTEKRLFQMGGEIASAFKARRMLYLNEFVDKHPRLPLGLYLGAYTRIIGKDKEWCIDIWAMDAKQVNQNRKIIAGFLAAMDENKRALILETKNKSLEHPEYQHNFFSIEIYKAVTEDCIKTVEEFFEWVKENRINDRTV